MSKRRTRADYANFDSDRATDQHWIRLKARCCGCHPQAHDTAIGCMMCPCEAGITDQRWLYEEELSTLVHGSTLSLFYRAMRALKINWVHDRVNGHRTIHSADFVRLARQVRLYMGLGISGSRPAMVTTDDVILDVSASIEPSSPACAGEG